MNMGMADEEFHEKSARTQRNIEQALAASTEEVEVVPLDEPSIEDYPFKAVSRCWCVGAECVGADRIPEDEFCFQEKNPPPTVHDGVRDTRNR